MTTDLRKLRSAEAEGWRTIGALFGCEELMLGSQTAAPPISLRGLPPAMGRREPQTWARSDDDHHGGSQVAARSLARQRATVRV